MKLTAHIRRPFAMTRQALPTFDRTKYASASRRGEGAHTSWLMPMEASPTPLLLATGSEVSLAVEAYEKLKAEGVKARVVSMPCWARSSSSKRRNTGTA